MRRIDPMPPRAISPSSRSRTPARGFGARGTGGGGGLVVAAASLSSSVPSNHGIASAAVSAVGSGMGRRTATVRFRLSLLIGPCSVLLGSPQAAQVVDHLIALAVVERAIEVDEVA